MYAHVWLQEGVKNLTVGAPFEEAKAEGYDMGPLISSTQLETVRSFIRQARAEGNTILTGGGTPEGVPDGFFVEPTVVGGVGVGDTLWRQEVFGPVVSITPFATNGEAVQLANDSQYGLGEKERGPRFESRGCRLCLSGIHRQ